MGTIAEKLSYLDETREQILTNIQALGGDLTEESTFRSYADALDEVWEEQDHVTGTGTELSLSTKKGKMKVDLSPSALEQGANPTPDNPQQIHTVSGENTINVTGKNLFDKSKATLNTLINRTTGALAESTTYATTDYMPVVAGQQYTFTNFNYWYVCSYDKDKNVLGNVDNLATITIPNNVYYLRGSFLMSNIDSVQFEKGNTATSYQAFQGSQSFNVNLGDLEYCKIGNYEDGFVRNSGKNLWNEQWENGYYNRTTGAKGSGNNYLRCDDYIPIQPNTTIYFTKPSEFLNYAVIFYDSSKTITGTIPTPTETQSKSFTAPANAYYFTFYLDAGSGTATYHNNIMINKGSEALPYEPYGSGEWYLKKNVGKVVLNASNVDTLITSFEKRNEHNSIYIVKTLVGWKTSWDSRVALMNRYKEVTLTSQADTNCFATTFNQASIIIWNDNFTDLATAKTQLIGTEIYIAQATPTYETITDTTLISQLETVWRANSYEDQTNVSQTNNDLPFVISAKALGIETESSTLSLNSLNTMSLNPRLDTEIVEPTVEEQEESVEEEEE